MPSIIASVGTITPFLNISGDIAPDLKAGDSESGVSGATMFDSILNDTEFTMSVSFTAWDDSEAPVELTVTAVSCLLDVAMPSVNISTTTNNATISGKIVDLFGEQWQFVMKDKSIRTLPINNKEDWQAVVRWIPAPINEEMLTYSFTVTYDDGFSGTGTASIDIPQYVYWNWQPSLENLDQLVREGAL